MDRFKQLLIIFFVTLTFIACTHQAKDRSDKTVDSLLKSSFNESISDTDYFDIIENFIKSENQIDNISFEAISTYNYNNQTVGFIFDTLKHNILIDSRLELPIFIFENNFRINEKDISFHDLNSKLMYDLLFSCKKVDSARVFRKEHIGHEVFYSSGIGAFIYLATDSVKSSIYEQNLLKKLTIEIVGAFYKRRNELSFFYKKKTYKELSYSDQQIIDSIVPMRIVICFNDKFPLI